MYVNVNAKRQSVKLLGYFRKNLPTKVGWRKQRWTKIYFYFKKMFFYFKKNNSILFITSPNIVRLSFHLIPPLRKSEYFLLWIFKCASFTEFHIKLLSTSYYKYYKLISCLRQAFGNLRVNTIN